MFIVRALSVRLPARAHRVPRAAARRSIEAARTLGLDARRAFWRVDLPLARPAIAGGIALALMETLADYGTVAYFAVDTFTTGIYRAWFSLGDKAPPRNSPRRCSPSSSPRCCSSAGRAARRARASGNRDAQPDAAGAAAARPAGAARSRRSICAVPIVVGFVAAGRAAAAAARVVGARTARRRALRRLGVEQLSRRRHGGRARRRCSRSLVAYAVRLAPGALTRATSRAAGAGLRGAGHGARRRRAAAAGRGRRAGSPTSCSGATGARPGLLLTGTIVALIYAYLVRYFAVAWNGIEPGVRAHHAGDGRRGARPRRRARPARCCACTRRCSRAARPRPRCWCSST